MQTEQGVGRRAPPRGPARTSCGGFRADCLILWTTALGGVTVRVREDLRSPGQGFGGLDETDSVAGGAKTTEDFERDGKKFASRSVFRTVGKASLSGGCVAGL